MHEMSNPVFLNNRFQSRNLLDLFSFRCLKILTFLETFATFAWQYWNYMEWVIIFVDFIEFPQNKLNINPFRLYWVCEWFASIYTAIKSIKIKFLPKVHGCRSPGIFTWCFWCHHFWHKELSQNTIFTLNIWTFEEVGGGCWVGGWVGVVDTLSGEAILPNLFCSSSEKEASLKGKNLLPFGTDVQNSKQEYWEKTFSSTNHNAWTVYKDEGLELLTLLMLNELRCHAHF